VQGLIFNIKRYSVHDGPGIRVTFFMKGCPLRCRWCHNPEGINALPEMVQTKRRIGENEFLKEEQVGTWYTADELVELAEREKIFMNKSGGGITFSGGEPMLQYDFLKEALKAFRGKGFHTAVDTSGFAPGDCIRDLCNYTDLFLFDLKHLDGKKHMEATGFSNDTILGNLDILLSSGREIWLRVPVIPGFNDDEDHTERLIGFIRSAGKSSLKKICLLPYHTIGSSKYKRFDLPYLMDGIQPPSREKMNELKLRFEKTGVSVKIGG
jgi:pyruvate formate lyase activating enzyme